MTLVEFLAALDRPTNADKVLAVLYYHARYTDTDGMTSDEIRAALVRARVPRAAKMNVADVLAKSGANVDTTGTRNGRKVWSITSTGEKEARRILGLPDAEPEVEHDVAALTTLAGEIRDDDVRGFVEEAVKCLQVGALRAAVVFLWTGAIRTLHAEAWALGDPAKLNSAIQKHDPKAREVRRAEDFSNIKDAVALKAFQDVGLIDKGQKATLEEALNLRNRCGHPTKYRPGPKKASSFIEDVVGIVF